MLRLLTDQNLNGDIVRGLFRRMQAIQLVRVQDLGLSEAEDPALLEWAASQGRILLTHDRRTIPRFAFERVRLGQPMPGVFVVDDSMPIGQAIDELSLAILCSSHDELMDLVNLLPAALIA